MRHPSIPVQGVPETTAASGGGCRPAWRPPGLPSSRSVPFFAARPPGRASCRCNSVYDASIERRSQRKSRCWLPDRERMTTHARGRIEVGSGRHGRKSGSCARTKLSCVLPKESFICFHDGWRVCRAWAAPKVTGGRWSPSVTGPTTVYRKANPNSRLQTFHPRNPTMTRPSAHFLLSFPQDWAQFQPDDKRRGDNKAPAAHELEGAGLGARLCSAGRSSLPVEALQPEALCLRSI